MSEALFRLDITDLTAVPKGLPLIVLLRPTTDVCDMFEMVEHHLLVHTEPRRLLHFEPDLLLDYRARRPEMLFKVDRIVSYEPPELALHLCTDSIGNNFLLLSGFEPDYKWDSFITALLLLIETLRVRLTVCMHSLPMPVPHTRPITKTLSGTLQEFITANSDWQPVTPIAANLGHVLEYRLSQAEADVIGCTLLLPQYLTSSTYPGAALAAISLVSRITDLIISTEDLLASDQAFNEEIAEQVAGAADHQEMIARLEARYDAFMQQHSANRDETALQPEPGETDEHTIPSAEQLAAEFTQFLESSGNDPKFNTANMGEADQSQQADKSAGEQAKRDDTPNPNNSES